MSYYFYAVITADAIGIFTSWENALQLVRGHWNRNQKFFFYGEALALIKELLAPEELARFGLDRRNPAYDEIVTRRPLLRQ